MLPSIHGTIYEALRGGACWAASLAAIWVSHSLTGFHEGSPFNRSRVIFSISVLLSDISSEVFQTLRDGSGMDSPNILEWFL